MYTEDEERGFSSLSIGKSQDKSLLIHTCFLNIFYSMRIVGKMSEKTSLSKVIYQERPKQTLESNYFVVFEITSYFYICGILL